MTDVPVRKITGLAPRRDTAPPLARLVKSERDRIAVDAPAEAAQDAPAAAAPAVVTAARLETPAVAPVTAPAAAEDIKEPVTVRWPRSLRHRSRAAFKATSNAEGDETYSDMVAKAVETELRRREGIYNGGRPFAGGDAQLPPGRPVG